MMTTPLQAPLDWSVRVEDVPARGLELHAVATEPERHKVATSLGLLALDQLQLHGRIEAVAGASYRLTGTLEAKAVQACVVTLEPVPTALLETVTVEFQPSAPAEDDLATTPDFDAVDIEPIVNGRLETGRIAFELLSAGLDPYPRKPGAGAPIDLTSMPKGAVKPNPFAVLAKLKDK